MPGRDLPTVPIHRRPSEQTATLVLNELFSAIARNLPPTEDLSALLASRDERTASYVGALVAAELTQGRRVREALADVIGAGEELAAAIRHDQGRTMVRRTRRARVRAAVARYQGVLAAAASSVGVRVPPTAVPSGRDD